MTAFAIILAAIIPAHELDAVRRVAADYKLTREQAAVLVAVRKVENGRPGLEFGVAQNFPKHPARRFADGRRSFEVQARWAAGTIKKRYQKAADLEDLARRYCPPNWRNWARMVAAIAKKAAREI